MNIQKIIREELLKESYGFSNQIDKPKLNKMIDSAYETINQRAIEYITAEYQNQKIDYYKNMYISHPEYAKALFNIVSDEDMTKNAKQTARKTILSDMTITFALEIDDKYGYSHRISIHFKPRVSYINTKEGYLRDLADTFTKAGFCLDSLGGITVYINMNIYKDEKDGLLHLMKKGVFNPNDNYYIRSDKKSTFSILCHEITHAIELASRQMEDNYTSDVRSYAFSTIEPIFRERSKHLTSYSSPKDILLATLERNIPNLMYRLSEAERNAYVTSYITGKESYNSFYDIEKAIKDCGGIQNCADVYNTFKKEVEQVLSENRLHYKLPNTLGNLLSMLKAEDKKYRKHIRKAEENMHQIFPVDLNIDDNAQYNPYQIEDYNDSQNIDEYIQQKSTEISDKANELQIMFRKLRNLYSYKDSRRNSMINKINDYLGISIADELKKQKCPLYLPIYGYWIVCIILRKALSSKSAKNKQKMIAQSNKILEEIDNCQDIDIDPKTEELINKSTMNIDLILSIDSLKNYSQYKQYVDLIPKIYKITANITEY